ncbi:MAG: hypothetical protein IJ125_05960 [Atopobiaceae bacterium]|nr:hypothetical protein [Atopobiaceae bacterium]
MSDGTNPLTDDERAELEMLRQQAAQRQQEEQASRERAELEKLRAQQAQAQSDAQEAARLRELKEQRKGLVEPDDDYKTPPMQKLVFLILAIVVVFFVLTNCHRQQNAIGNQLPLVTKAVSFGR